MRVKNRPSVRACVRAVRLLLRSSGRVESVQRQLGGFRTLLFADTIHVIFYYELCRGGSGSDGKQTFPAGAADTPGLEGGMAFVFG